MRAGGCENFSRVLLRVLLRVLEGTGMSHGYAFDADSQATRMESSHTLRLTVCPLLISIGCAEISTHDTGRPRLEFDSGGCQCSGTRHHS